MISSFSQTTYPKPLNDSLVIITNEQLKKVDLIFLEHSKFKQENLELNKQITNYEKLVLNYQETERLNEAKIKEYKDYSEKAHADLIKQEEVLKSYKSKNKTLKIVSIGGVTVSAALLILLLVK